MKTRQSFLICMLTILAASAWTLFAQAPAPAATTPSTSVNAVIDAGKTFAPINPNLYGMFIEFDPDGHLVEIGEPMERYASWVGHTRRFYADNGGLDAGK